MPLDARNIYGCSIEGPRHLSSNLKQFRFQLPYEGLFGGAIAVSTKIFEEINGFSNNYSMLAIFCTVPIGADSSQSLHWSYQSHAVIGQLRRWSHLCRHLACAVFTWMDVHLVSWHNLVIRLDNQSENLGLLHRTTPCFWELSLDYANVRKEPVMCLVPVVKQNLQRIIPLSSQRMFMVYSTTSYHITYPKESTTTTTTHGIMLLLLSRLRKVNFMTMIVVESGTTMTPHMN